jgi:ArsR family transcriptional regulator
MDHLHRLVRMVASISTVVNIEICRYSGDVDDVQILQAIAEPTRLAIVRQLASDGEVCACDFTDCCDVSQPTVSHHLKVLREAGVVSGERRGTWIYYRLEPKAASRIAALGHLLSAGAQREPKRVSSKPALARA